MIAPETFGRFFAVLTLSVAMIFQGFFGLFSALTADAASNNPKLLNYQARITDDTGIPVADGTLNVAFAIYSTSSGASGCLWSASNTDATDSTIDCTSNTPDGLIPVTVKDGVFSVVLGDTADGQNALPDDLFDGDTRYLGITVESDSEMTPRKRITSAPYAFNADRLDDLDTSSTGGTGAYVPVTDSSGNLTITGTGIFAAQSDSPTSNLLQIQDASGGTQYFTVSSTSTQLAGDLLPAADNTYDLGSSTQRWKDLWLAGGTAHIAYDTSGTTTIDIGFDDTNDLRSSLTYASTSIFNIMEGSIKVFEASPNLTLIGRRAGESHTTGLDTVAIGENALRYLTTGNYNVAVGARALENTVDGQYNNAFGFSALNDNVSGSSNIAIGHSAMSASVSGDFNVVVGRQALNNSISGERNVALGYRALFNNTSATNTVAIGYLAGEGVDGFSSENNTLVGYWAGRGLSSGSNNIFLGYQTADDVTTGSGNIVIGYQEDTPAITTSDHLNIGGTLFGDLSSNLISIGSPYQTAARLSLAAGASPTSNIFEITNDDGAGLWDSKYFTVSSTNTTIGSASTTDTVTFDSRVASDLIPSADATYDLGSTTNRWNDLFLTGNTIHIGPSSADEGQISFDPYFDFRTNTYFEFRADTDNNGSSGPLAKFYGSLDTEDFYIEEGGGTLGSQVGIDTFSPEAKLHIQLGVGSNVEPGANNKGLLIETNQTIQYPVFEVMNLVDSYFNIFNEGQVAVGSRYDGARFSIADDTTSENIFEIVAVDDIGNTDYTSKYFTVSTTSTSIATDLIIESGGHNIDANLDIYANTGGVASRGLWVGPEGNRGAFLYLSTGDAEISPRSGKDLVFANAPTGTELMRIESNGNVGIGTSPAATALDIVGSDFKSLLRLSNTSTDATQKQASITGRHYTNAEEDVVLAYLSSNSGSTTLNIGGGVTALNGVTKINFNTTSDTTTLNGTTHMVVTNSGTVGIGDESPDGKLEVRQTTTSDILNLYDDTVNVFTVRNGGTVGIADQEITIDGLVSIRQDGGGDIFNIYDASTNVLTVQNSGEVGIGTGNPSAWLTVSASGTPTANIFEVTDRTHTDDYTAKYFTVSSTSTLINSDDLSGYYLGIGNAAPSADLHIGDGTTSTAHIKLDGGNPELSFIDSTDADFNIKTGGERLLFEEDGTTIMKLGDARLFIANSSGADRIVFNGDGTSYFSQNTELRFGLGDSTPEAFLDISGSASTTGIIINQNSSSDQFIQFQEDEVDIFRMGVDNSTANNDFVIADGGTLGTNDRFVIDGSTGAVTVVEDLIVGSASTSNIIDTQNVRITGNLTPSTDDTYDLGDWNRRWKDLYLSGNTIHIGDTVNEATISLNGSNQLALSAPGGTTFSGDVTIAGTCTGCGGASTLQAAYDGATSQPHITLTSSDGEFSIRDNGTALGTSLFTVSDSTGNDTYFLASATNTEVYSRLTAPRLDFSQVTETPGAPSSALGSGTGITEINSLVYAVSFVTPEGETLIGAASSPGLAPSNQDVDLTNIPVASNGKVTARNIYRKGGFLCSTSYKLIATISDNTTTTYNDSTPCGSESPGTAEPTVNTTGGIISLSGTSTLEISESGITSNIGLTIGDGSGEDTLTLDASNVTTGDAFSITGGVTSGDFISIAGSSLTSGSALSITGGSSFTNGLIQASSSGNFSGSLIKLVSNSGGSPDPTGALIFMDASNGSGDPIDLIYVQSDYLNGNQNEVRLTSAGELFLGYGNSSSQASLRIGDINNTGLRLFHNKIQQGQSFTISASQTLTIGSDAASVAISLAGGSGDDFTVDGTTFTIESDTNEVGIGTSSPAGNLEIQESINNSAVTAYKDANNFLHISNTDGTNGNTAYIRSEVSGDGYSFGTRWNANEDEDFVILHETTADTAAVWFWIDGGSGQTYLYTPSQSTNGACFDTDGTSTHAFTNCSSTPSDIAEWYPATATATTTDILVATNSTFSYSEEIYSPWTGQPDGTTQDLEVSVLDRSSVPYDDRIIGIVSTSPYRLFGSAVRDSASNPVPMAITGRVPTRVVLENGEIESGDPITTSSTAGAGMKATKPGMIVGYALEDFTGPGEGVINVLVSPQWHSGATIGTDGEMSFLSDDFTVDTKGDATFATQAYDSLTLSFRASAWDSASSTAVTRDITMSNVLTDKDTYGLSFLNNDQEEITRMGQSGDLYIAGKLFPSDRGTLQEDKYIFYDGSAGPGGDMMRTNAAGWSTGSYDFAEMFPTREEDTLVPGTIVVADTENDEGIIASTSSYQNAILGIISTKPGFLAGENKEGDAPVALIGRVPTKVNLENGPITIGDPITSSSEEGVGMKATEPGRVVGIALQKYDGSNVDEDGNPTDMIVVYVNPSWWNGPQEASGTETAGSALTIEANSIIDFKNSTLTNVEGIIAASGMWSIGTDGHLVAKHVQADTVTAKNFVVQATDELSTVGKGLIKDGYNATFITNAAMKADSTVFVSFIGKPSVDFSWGIEPHDGDFLVHLSKPAIGDLEFNYWILGIDDQRTEGESLLIEDMTDSGSGTSVVAGESIEETPSEEPPPEPDPISEPEPEPAPTESASGTDPV